MKLTFNRSGVERLLAHAQSARSWRAPYGEKDATAPALWVVADQGIYLMSNGEPPLIREDKPDAGFVVYADQVNPDTMPFDEWWATKRRAAGGDDGVDAIEAIEFIEALRTYRPGEALQINMTPQRIGIVEFKSKR